MTTTQKGSAWWSPCPKPALFCHRSVSLLVNPCFLGLGSCHNDSEVEDCEGTGRGGVRNSLWSLGVYKPCTSLSHLTLLLGPTSCGEVQLPAHQNPLSFPYGHKAGPCFSAFRWMEPCDRILVNAVRTEALFASPRPPTPGGATLCLLAPAAGTIQRKQELAQGPWGKPEPQRGGSWVP